MTSTRVTASDKADRRESRRETAWKNIEADRESQPPSTTLGAVHTGVHGKHLTGNSREQRRNLFIQLPWYLCPQAFCSPSVAKPRSTPCPAGLLSSVAQCEARMAVPPEAHVLARSEIFKFGTKSPKHEVNSRQTTSTAVVQSPERLGASR